MTPVVAFGVLNTVLTVGGWFTTRAVVAARVVTWAVSGSATPIWRRATAANIQASGDSVGIRGIAPRIDDRMGVTIRFTATVI